MRMHGHAEHDPADYVLKELYEEYAKKDPVELFEGVLLERGRARRRRGQAGPRGGPPGRHRRAAQGARRPDARSQQHRGRCLCRLRTATATYLDAVSAALDAEMERDPDVFLIGEDVGQFGGAFKVTKGFLDKFGPRRVVDTPIAETGFTGLAAGAALVGLRPVVEFQFADFISCAFDPIINVLARHHWRTGDAMPVTMRAPFGARLRAGPTHSQSVESYFAHVPGLKIVDAGHARGRRGAAGQLDPGQQPHAVPGEQVPLPAAAGVRARCRSTRSRSGSAKVVREGRDVSLITYSAGVSAGPRGGRGAGQGRHLGRGRRRAHAGAAGRRDDRQLGAQDLARGGAARGARSGWATARRSRRPSRRSASGTSTSRWCASRRRTPRRPPARRWRTR